jgi:hypothetical protein
VTRGGQTLGAVHRMRAAVALAIAWALCAPLAATASAAVPAGGRVWELVTSGPDNGVQLFGANGWTPDGNAIAYGSFGPLPGAPSGELIAMSVATRTSQGWQARRVGIPFTAPRAQLFETRAFGVSGDLRTWLWGSADPLVPGGPSFPSTGLYRLAPDGTVTLLGDLGSTFTFLVTDPEGVSDDAQHVALSDNAALLPEDAGRVAGRAAYEFAGTTLRLAGVEDGGAPISSCGGSVVGNGSGDPRLQPNAMSRDGSKIFFTAPSPEASFECPDELTHVYLRENGTHTVDVSATRCTRADCQGPSLMHFAAATPDGAFAFVTTVEQMTDEDTADNVDLYRIATATGDVTLVSAAQPGASTDVEEGAMLTTDDGRHVAFVGYGQLVPGKGAPGERAAYLWDDGRLHYVGALEQTDLRTASLSAEGGVLLLTTASQLLPSDTDEHVDVYRYDVASDTLTQVSLGDGGAGNGAFDASTPDVAPGGFPNELPRSLSADGRRAFFTTPESLLPEDVNDRSDVYEWSDGRLGLVSAGTAGVEATFQGASPDGRDAFIQTDATLTPDDRDNGDRDLYDARVGGGFPREPPPGEEQPSREPPPREPPPTGCGTCQGPPPATGSGATPKSTTPPARGRSPPAPRVHLVLPKLSATLLARLAHSGTVVVSVRGAVTGRLTLTGSARIGRRLRLVLTGAAQVRKAGTVHVRLRLTAVARRALRVRGARLRITLTVAQPGVHAGARGIVVLKGVPR